MKHKKYFIITELLLISTILYCVNEYNPFDDPDNTGVVIISQSTESPDSFPIFHSDTITIKIAFPELLDSFTITTKTNRFWEQTSVQNAASKTGTAGNLISFLMGVVSISHSTIAAIRRWRRGENTMLWP